MPENARDLLEGLTHSELEALADGMLASPHQSRLDDLIRRNSEGGLSAEELNELDHLVLRIDQLMLLKAKAKYTLQVQGAAKL